MREQIFEKIMRVTHAQVMFYYDMWIRPFRAILLIYYLISSMVVSPNKDIIQFDNTAKHTLNKLLMCVTFKIYNNYIFRHINLSLI